MTLERPAIIRCRVFMLYTEFREHPLLVGNFLSKISPTTEELGKGDTELVKMLKSVSNCEKILLTSNDETKNFPINRFLLYLDDVFLRFDQGNPYVRSALGNKYVWFASVGMIILYSGSMPFYFRNFKLIQSSSANFSELARPFNFLLMSQTVTLTSYIAFVALLNISGRTSCCELIDQLIIETRKENSIKVIESLKISQNSLLFKHLAQDHKLFAPLLEYYLNPNFIGKFTMENYSEFPMPISNIEAYMTDDIQVHPPYEYLDGASIKKSSLPLLLQFFMLFGPLPRPIKSCTHFLILADKGLTLGRRFLAARKRSKVEKAREKLIEQFK